MFREAVESDLAGILRLYRQMHPADPPLADEQAQETFARILNTPGLTLFVLEADGDLVATTYLNVVPNLTRAAAPYAVIENVVVDEERRRTGLGKRIIAGTLEVAWQSGCYKVMLQTGSRRPAVHDFYRACGFDPNAKFAFLARPTPSP